MSTAASSQNIDFTSANLLEIAPPGSVVEGALEDDDHAVVFAERQDFLLVSDLDVDADNAGAEVVGSTNTASPGFIPAGRRVSSYLVHYDTVGQPVDPLGQGWFLSFQNTDLIVGLIYSDGLLDASDYLGAPGTTYPTGETYRGMTGFNEGADQINWSQFYAFSGTQSVTVEVDQIRIILAVPEPGSIALTSATLSALLFFVRRSNRSAVKA
jgi:hypothetical protein